MDDNFYLNTLLLVLLEWPVLLPLLCVLCFWGLKKRQFTKNSIFFNNFFVGGHRGSPINKPENTIASMEQAKLEGTDLVEFDVSLTKDGIAVILHDDTLDRTTNLVGPIRQVLYKDLQKCNCAAKFHSENSQDGSAQIQSLPTLDQMVKWAKAEGQKMLFDVKDTDSCLVHKLEELFEEYQLYDAGIVCSFWPTVVYRIKHHNPRILTGITWRRGFFSYVDLQHKTRRFTSPPLHLLAVAFDVLYVWSIKSWLPAFLGVDLILTERKEISENTLRIVGDKDLESTASIVESTLDNPTLLRVSLGVGISESQIIDLTLSTSEPKTRYIMEGDDDAARIQNPLIQVTQKSLVSIQKPHPGNFVRQQERSGRKVCAWTVNDLNEMEWMRKTLKIPFLTDKPFLAKRGENGKQLLGDLN